MVVHKSVLSAKAGEPLRITATIAGEPDSVMIYPATADFWRDNNVLVPMVKTGKYEYSATIDPGVMGNKDRFDYRIVVFKGADAVTWPSGEHGTPLDWDFGAGRGLSHASLPPCAPPELPLSSSMPQPASEERNSPLFPRSGRA